MFFKYGNIDFEGQSVWILGENNKIEKIQIGQLQFEKETDKEILPDKDDFNPDNNNSVEIFMSPSFIVGCNYQKNIYLWHL